MRLDFSNYGECCDGQGWGEQILAAGYGTLDKGTGPDSSYTLFGGTSGAAPIVAAAVVCLQAIRKAAGKPLLTPVEIRRALRATGSPQVWNDRIGNRPDLARLINWEATGT